MSAIQIDNGYLIITADEDTAYAEGKSRIGYTESGDGCDLTFETEKEAENAFDQLAEVLCSKWLKDDSENLMS